MQALTRPRAPESLPVRLDRRRVYVLPTATGLFFALLLGTMGLGALNYNNNPALLLALLLAGAAQASLLFAHLQLSGVRIEAVAAEPVAAGEPLSLRIALGAGDARQRRGLQLRHGDEVVHASFDASGTTAELRLPTSRRGLMPLPRLELRTVQPLGLARAWAYAWPAQSVLVYPRPLQGELPLSDGGSLDEEDEGQRATGQGADDYQGLRSYQPGDSKRRLHWKAFSRGQGLLVKDFAALAGRDLWLDFQALGGDAEERLSRLCYWVLQLDARQQAYGLRLPGCELAPDHGDAHREACLRALALYGVRT